jgi:hypothetical protein
MMQDSEQELVFATMERINRAWLNGRIDDLEPMLHEEIVMVLPGFAGAMRGRKPFLAGFKDFCDNAKIHEFREYDRRGDIAGGTAVVSFRYEMVYERSDERYRTWGRDLWVFERRGSGWVAVWRTMLDVAEGVA